MMEKYAVDQSMIPPTDDQLITIKKLNGILQKEASDLRTRPHSTQSDHRGRRSGNRNLTFLAPSHLLQRLCVAFPMSQSQPEARPALVSIHCRAEGRRCTQSSSKPAGARKNLRKMSSSV